MFDAAQMHRYWLMALDWTIIYLPKTIFAIIIFFIGSSLIRHLNKMFEKALTIRRVDNTIRPFLASLIDKL